MEIGLLLGFWGVVVLLVLTPGADWAYAISTGVQRRPVLPAVGGLLLGYVGITALVALGLAALVATTPGVLPALTVAGAAYLGWLGIQVLRSPGTPESMTGAVDTAWWAQSLKGAAVSGLNPKGLLLFIALLPQFTDASGSWPLVAQVGALGGVHIATCAVVYTGVGLAARRVLATRAGAARVVSRVSGGMMLVIGAALLVEQVLHLV